MIKVEMLADIDNTIWNILTDLRKIYMIADDEIMIKNKMANTEKSISFSIVNTKLRHRQND